MVCFCSWPSFGSASIVNLAVDAGGRNPGRAVRRTGRAVRPCGWPPPGRGSSAWCPGQGQHVVDHLRDGLRLECLVVVGADGRAGAGEEQAQVVVDLGDGADRRARVVAGRLLLDGNGRATRPSIRSTSGFPSTAGTGGRRPTATRRSGAGPRRRGCRTRARTCRKPGQAGDHDKPVARQVEIDVLEVVGARAADADFFHGEWLRGKQTC